MIAMFAFLIASVASEVLGQLCFKLGVGHGEGPGLDRGIGGFIVELMHSRWILTGLGVYVIEFIAWFAALSVAPLSFAFPFATLSYCGVVLVSRYILKEQVSARRWIGTLAIATGVAVVCWP